MLTANHLLLVWDGMGRMLFMDIQDLLLGRRRPVTLHPPRMAQVIAEFLHLAAK